MLALRNPLDTQQTDTQGIRSAALLGQPAPAPVIKVVKRGAARGRRPAPCPRARAEDIHGRGHPCSQAYRRGGPLKRHPATQGKLALLFCALVAATAIDTHAQQAVDAGCSSPHAFLSPWDARRSLNTDFDVTRIAVTNPAVADAVVVAPREILIDGKGARNGQLIVWGPTQRSQYDIVVEPGVSVLQQQLQQLFPGENIQVSFSDQAIILSGSVSSNAVMLRVGEIALATSPKLKVINMLQLPGGSESQQVMLQVRFAEVNRRALTEAGVRSVTAVRDQDLRRPLDDSTVRRTHRLR